jgi:RNase P subunit RPR2
MTLSEFQWEIVYVCRECGETRWYNYDEDAYKGGCDCPKKEDVDESEEGEEG